MAIVPTLGKEVIRIVCAYGPQSGKPDTEKVHFYEEMVSEGDIKSSSEMILSLEDFNGHVRKCAEDFEGVPGENGIVKRNAENGWSSVMKKSCASKHMVLQSKEKENHL